MAYLDTIKLVTGDTLPDLRFVLKDQSEGATGVTFDENDSTTWAPIDITGATVRLRIRKIGSTDIDAIISGVLSDPSNGVVIIPFTSDSFSASGLYEGELEVTFSSGGIQTVYDLVKFKVRNDFD
jgi:hypothetical protein